MKDIHTAVLPSPPSCCETFSSCKTETQNPLSTTSPFPSPPSSCQLLFYFCLFHWLLTQTAYGLSHVSLHKVWVCTFLPWSYLPSLSPFFTERVKSGSACTANLHLWLISLGFWDLRPVFQLLSQPGIFKISWVIVASAFTFCCLLDSLIASEIWGYLCLPLSLHSFFLFPSLPLSFPSSLSLFLLPFLSLFWVVLCIKQPFLKFTVWSIGKLLKE